MKKSFQQKFIYRINTYIQIIGTFIVFFININVWEALYNGKEAIKGITLGDMITYIVISTFVQRLSRSNVAYEIASKVKDGSIGIELMKPINIKYYFIFNDLGNNFFYSLFITFPAAIVISVIYDFRIDIDFLQLFMFLICLFLGIYLMFCIHYIFGLLAFWFQTGEYVAFFTRACMTLFSGSTIPLWFYPKTLYSISVMLPFRLVNYEPIQIYLEKISYDEAFRIIFMQIIWIILLLVLEKIMWSHVQNKIVIQGG